MADSQKKVIDLLNANKASGVTSHSFEFFPPKTEQGDTNLMSRMGDFKQQKPVFVDFTWGAGGTTSEKTIDLCLKTMNQHNLIVNMHLTCTNMPQGKVKEALDICKAKNIKNIVALRGDPPAGTEWQASADGFGSALDLVKYIKANYGDFFSIAVAGYPEGHPVKIGESGLCTEEDMEGEMAYLKEKIDAGGDYIITQLFYDNKHFFKFAERCQKMGITCPILPGMLPMQSLAGLKRMVDLCKTDVPADVMAKAESLKDDEVAFKQYGVDLTTSMIEELVAGGVKHMHYYTLNTTPSTFAIMKKLNTFTELEQ